MKKGKKNNQTTKKKKAKKLEWYQRDHSKAFMSIQDFDKKIGLRGLEYRKQGISVLGHESDSDDSNSDDGGDYSTVDDNDSLDEDDEDIDDL